MVTVELEMSVADCRTLYTAVCDAINAWPGSPARPPEEQVQMRQLKYFLFSILAEASLDEWKKVAATLLALPKKLGKDKANIPNQITAVKRVVDKENNI